ncbi:MAG: CvpA family protein [Lachnospiraceae bacterium]|jgi:uncharacterized membrane protein required for colicin V production|nr:CvpA family protein [Lachnospiraceae bacterium]
MNVVAIVIGIVFLICVISGWARGLFRVLISVAGLVVGLIVAFYVAPHVSSNLIEHSDTDEKLAMYIAEKLEFSDTGKEVSKGVQVSLIESLPLPGIMKKNMLDNNNKETYDLLGAVGVYDYISKSLAVLIINGFVYVFLVLVCRVAFFFLQVFAKGVQSIPIVGSVDKLGGAGLGCIKGLLLIWLFFFVLSLTSTMGWSKELIEQISDVWVLKLLYDNNLILDIVGDFTKILFI